MAYRIITFDGGGIRGLFSAVLLDRIVKAFPTLLENTQLLAGTSTGGIIALGLAAGLSTEQLISLYRDNGPKIFDSSWLRHLADLDGLAGSDYDNTELQKILTGLFGTRTLGDLKKKVLIPSFDMDSGQDPFADPPRTWKPKFFHNFEGDDSDGEQKMVDVALRTSAAPIFFPSYEHYADGGLVANNPSMSALAQAIDPETGNQKLDDIRLLSIGTGITPTFISGSDHDWGLAHWARNLVSVMIDGVMGVADYQCKKLLRTCYYRLSPALPHPIGLDETGGISDLIQFANDVPLDGVLQFVNTHFA